ncbi:MAG: hypothetical protein AB8B56_00590 [Crocinitomicaceae bacterium]
MASPCYTIMRLKRLSALVVAAASFYDQSWIDGKDIVEDTTIEWL